MILRMVVNEETLVENGRITRDVDKPIGQVVKLKQKAGDENAGQIAKEKRKLVRSS